MEKEWLDMLAQTIPKEMMLGYLDDHPELEEYTIQLAYQNLDPQSWRACWLTQLVCTKNDPRLKPHINEMIQSLIGKSDGHQRELLKVIQKADWNEDQEGYLFEQCLSICGSIEKSPSVRITAFRVLAKLIGKYPELWYEIQFIIEEDYLDTLSHGIKNGFIKELAALKKKILPLL
jgi:hypothetical protein